MKTLLPLLPLLLAASAGAASNPGDAADVRSLLRGMDGMARLPVSGVQMVSANGRVLFVSANGRYVFAGPAWDLWHGARLDSIETANRLAGRIDLKRLRLDPADLGAIDIGTGNDDTLIFVDPLCPHCAELLKALAPLVGQHRFRLVPLPVLGTASERAALRLHCLAETDPAAAGKALLAHTAESLPAPGGTCGQRTAQRALVTAQLLGIAGVPYLIAPDGRMRQGAPEDLAAWLAGEGE